MLDLNLGSPGDPLNVLCIGAHGDDIEIGCGGTLLQWQAQRPLNLHWVVFASDDERRRELESSSERFFAGCAKGQLIVKEHRDGFLPHSGAVVKDEFEQLKSIVQPDLILTHTRADLHQDHRLLCELTWNTFRDHTILEYEIPKYDGDLGRPNCYQPLSEAACEAKVEHLLASYGSQANKRWFTRDLFFALLRLRGMECNAPSGLAEAFFGRKLRLPA